MKLVLAFLLAAFGAVASAQTPQPPEVAARQYLLIDLSSNQVLAEREADAQAEPASLTKLMTAYVVFAALRDKKLALDQRLPVSERAWAERAGIGWIGKNSLVLRRDIGSWFFLGAVITEVELAPDQFARLRPLNDMVFGRAAALLREEQKDKASRAGVDPRLMAFLANVSALGVLTMKGMVENVGDPLLYSDEQLVDALSRIFEAAAAP